MASGFGVQILSTNILVDGFRRKSKKKYIYFLTHFHSDHYAGITKNWSKGFIYCSQITCELLQKCIGVDLKVIIYLHINDFKNYFY
jgi:Cft2 family RNA processing exonuclease